jgi:DNA-binding beta-propeller fold protein YncE
MRAAVGTRDIFRTPCILKLLYTVSMFCFILMLQLCPHALGDERVRTDRGFELFKEGVYHFNRKSYEAAIDFLRKSLGRNPQDRNARYFLAMAYYKAGYNENALFELETLRGEYDQNETIQNLIRYLSTNSLIPAMVRKSDDYTLGWEIKANPIGKYILSRITGIDVDDLGNVYAAGFGSKIALKISREGKPLFIFSSPRITTGRLYDIVLGKDGEVFISDFTNDTIYKFLQDGTYEGSIGGPGFGNGQFYGPTALAVDRFGDLYAIDSGNIRVLKFSREGEFLLSFGSEGDEQSEFSHPSGIAVDSAGNIYVSDHGKKKIMLFDRFGNFIQTIPDPGLKDPYGISISGESRLIVGDGNTIRSYNLANSTWTDIDTADRFSRVMDVRMDHLGQLYACDYDRDTLLQFVPEQDKYRNLNVVLDRIDTSGFPMITYYVTVRDADGYPIYGLTESNFLLRIGSGVVKKIDLSSNALRNSRHRLLFLVDKSSTMKQYSEDVKSYMSALISRVSTEDEMAVIGYNRESWISSSFTPSKLRTMDAILEDRYSAGNSFDTAFRRAVDYINKEYFKKAILVITDGRITEESFRTHSFEGCIRYAANNHIPVYFLSFGGSVNERLLYFARNTGGRFYDVLHSNDFPYLYSSIQQFRSSDYLIFFRDVYDPKFQNLYLDAEVEVDFDGRTGKSSLGLIYPSRNY